MRRISADDVKYMHSLLVGENNAVRDEGLLESAVNAGLAYGLIKNHAFIDGNKRIALLSMLVLLKCNDVDIVCSEEELYREFMGLASSEVTFDDLVSWIVSRSK